MQSITKILLYYFLEQKGRLSFEVDEEETKAYTLLEEELSKPQKNLFISWETLKTERHCKEIEFCFDFAFKKGISFMIEIFSEFIKEE